MQTTTSQKYSHADFYHQEQEEKETEQARDCSLIQSKLGALDGLVKKQEEAKSNYLTLSDQPYSKWQAIFNLEQIKERNKPKLQKESVPKAPFFLFDLEKATTLEGGETKARDFLAETFFTNFD